MFCSRCGTEVENQSKFCPSCGLDLAATTPLAALGVDTGEKTEIAQVREALKDEYEIVSELGRGGMAIVYRAKELALDREVAIKVLPFSLAYDKEFVERFQREARTAGRLEHSNIIPIYRVGKSGRVIFFIMKFLRGQSLSELLEQRGTLPPGEIRRLLKETASALGYASKHEIVHRDIKPDNIMFDESGRAIVTDFGIAKAATSSRLTGTGMSIGTPHYMSPEQARAQKLDGRSDIYSLGIVAFQCLTGSVPYDGEDAFSIGYKHIMEEIPVPQLESGEHREIFHIIHRMLAKAPDERYQNAEQLIRALEGKGVTPAPARATSASDLPTTVMPRAVAGLGTPSQGVAPAAMPPTPTTPIPKLDPQSEPRKKSSGVLVGMLFLLALGGSGAGGYWYFVMGAPWPVVPPDTAVSQPPVGDSLQLAASDSGTVSDSVAPTGSDSMAVAGPSVTDLPNTGTLVLLGVPRRGATVKVDGEPVGDSVITVDAGSKSIEVTRTGFQPFRHTAQVPRGDTVTVAVTLRRLQQAAPAPPPQPKTVCDAPGSAYNRDGSCFDLAPTVDQACLLPRPQGAEGQLTALFWVKVLADGTRGTIERQQQSTSGQFNIAAVRFAMQARYAPAQKDRVPVDAWLRILCRAR